MRIANITAAIVAITCTLSGAAHAGTIGTATAKDVTLDGVSAHYLAYASGVNPQNKKRGGTAGFASAYSNYGSTGWSAIAQFSGNAYTSTGVTSGGLLADKLTINFGQITGTSGAWGITNTDTAQDLKLDLVFAVHTGGGSGAWLFNEQAIGAGDTLSGSWMLKLLNNGTQIGDYSNMTLFARDARWSTASTGPATSPSGENGPTSGNPSSEIGQPTGNNPILVDIAPDDAVAEVAEPASFAMILGGLGIMGLMRRRERSAK